MTDNDIKKILNSVMGQYINFETRKNFEESVQKNTVLINKGICRACEVIINDFGKDTQMLEDFAKEKLKEVIRSGAQKVHLSEGNYNE